MTDLIFYAELFLRFFRVGLFSIGGGMATIPFLQEMGEETGWFSTQDLMNMLAISESTPGPIGINMATYVGYVSLGVWGGLIATLGEIAPSIIIILIIAHILGKFRHNKYVEAAFYGLRPASTGLIASAAVTVMVEVLFQNRGLAGFSLKALILGIIVWFLSNVVKKTKGLHPICFIVLCAVVGIIFRF